MRYLACVLGAAIAAAGLPAAPARAQTSVSPQPGTPPAAAPQPPPNPAAAALEVALQNFPPLIIGANTQATGPNGPAPPSCPAAGSRVEQSGGPTMEFEGASPDDPELCRLKVGGEPLEAWFGIWGKGWAGGDHAHRALKRILQGRTGDVVGFDTDAAPHAKWHDLIRHDGVEDIKLLGKSYKAVKLAHYREGFDGNTYRSVSTLWIDLASGLPIYGTYNHISGAPELHGQLIPAAIVPAP